MKWLSALQHLVTGSDPTNPTSVVGMEYFNNTYNVKKVYNGTAWLYSNVNVLPFTIQGELSVGITGRTQRVYNRSGAPWVLLGMNLYVATAPTGSDLTLQVNKNGSSWQTITVTAGSNNANNNPGSSVDDGDYVDVDVTAVGSTVAGSDATLTLNFAS